MLNHYVYILASQQNGTIYIGKTNNLQKRIHEHKNKLIEGFTSKYDVNLLVHYEVFDDHENAANRERKLKNWKRKWKLELIESQNPDWNDLYDEIIK